MIDYRRVNEKLRKRRAEFLCNEARLKTILEKEKEIKMAEIKARQKQAIIDMMRGDEQIGLYDDNPKNH